MDYNDVTGINSMNNLAHLLGIQEMERRLQYTRINKGTKTNIKRVLGFEKNCQVHHYTTT